MKEAIRFGVARGLFSNESGLGSAPIVAAAAMTKNPVRQALVSSTGTFWDTVVVCAMTGLVVVNSGDWHAGLKGAALTKTAFSHIPHVGPIVLTVGLLTFVFSTILGWSYYGEKAAEYLFGPKIILPYRWLWVVAVMVGSVATLPAVWSFADIANGLMAIPNLDLAPRPERPDRLRDEEVPDAREPEQRRARGVSRRLPRHRRISRVRRATPPASPCRRRRAGRA